MKNFALSILILLLTCLFAQAQILPELEKVKEIKLLESSRDDVRRILADYDLNYSDDTYRYETFSTKNSGILVNYSDGKCSDNYEDWDVSEWKVEEIEISFESPIKTYKSGIDFASYKRERKYINLPRAVIYHNKNWGIAFDVYKHDIYKIYIYPSKKSYSLLCDNQKSKEYISRKDWFKTNLKKRFYYSEPANIPANVENLVLSLPEITANCSSSDSVQNRNCSDGVKAITVSTVAKDPDNDVLTYSYSVSGGKISGRGEKVIWDLSGVKPGSYTIEVIVDDGCGFCGKSMTKTVVVKECPNCGQN